MTSYALSQVPPIPPLVMPTTAQTVTTMIVAVLGAVALVAATALGRRHRTPLYLVVLLGGALASLNEPVADLLGGCMHPQQGSWVAFSTFDRPIPVWVVIAYGLFFGAVPLVLVALMRGGNPRRRFVTAVGVIFAANLVIELPVLAAGMYVYYGEQPFKVFGLFPLYWLFINSAGVATVAVVLLRFGHLLRGANLGWALLLPPGAQIFGYLVGMPAFSMFNTDADSMWKWAGALATMLLGAAVLRALSRLVPDHVLDAGPEGPASVPKPSTAGVAGA